MVLAAAADELADQCENPYGDVWILEGAEHGVAGQMVVQDQGPPWRWTDEERSEPALYLSGSTLHRNPYADTGLSSVNSAYVKEEIIIR